MTAMHLVIIGGSDAGIAAALRARELSKEAKITVLLADGYPNYSICGLPYLIGGQTPDVRKLAHRTTFPDIDMRLHHRVIAIDPGEKSVTAEWPGGTTKLRYDRLIVATGAHPVRPDIPGADLPGAFVFHTIDDGLAVLDTARRHPSGKAVIVGAGYIGIEMAEALQLRGLQVTLLSRSDEVMPGVFPEIGAMIRERLIAEGVEVVTQASVERIEEGLVVVTTQGQRHPADIVLLATGVRPAVDLAREAGAALGESGAIAVSETMATSLPDIFAAGDCVVTRHRLRSKPDWISLGTIAHKQGRIAGENAIGGARTFHGIVGTQSLKLYDLVIARTGLSDALAQDEGYDPLTVQIGAWDHKSYYPGATQIGVWITGDTISGRLLGMQMVGRAGAEVSKRLDIVAAGLFHGMSVEDLNDLDLSYTPPLSSPWDPVQRAAQEWSYAARAISKQLKSTAVSETAENQRK